MTPERRAQQVLRETGADTPIDIDVIASKYSEGIEIEDLPARRPAMRIGRNLLLHRALSRHEQRWHGAHELHHIIEDTPDQIGRIYRPDPSLAQEEAEADLFAMKLLMPDHVVSEAVLNNWSVEECVCAFGLPASVILSRMEQWHAERARAAWRF